MQTQSCLVFPMVVVAAAMNPRDDVVYVKRGQEANLPATVGNTRTDRRHVPIPALGGAGLILYDLVPAIWRACR